MRTARCLLVGVLGVLGLAAAPGVLADEADGLRLPRMQGRVRLGMSVDPGTTDLSRSSAQAPRLNSISLLGDFYFDRSATRSGDTHGFRATSGIFLGSRLGMWGGPTGTSPSSALLSVERHSFSLLTPARSSDSAADGGAVPYLGFGYSGSSVKSGWGFSADLGLMALNPGNAVRLGRVFGGSPNLDDLVRELRLSPVVQLGVSYSF